MKIQAIYEKYRIMPSLQLHMLRVTAVAQLICNSIQKQVNQQDILSACLLHDMGNILKFNMELFPEFFEPEGKEYWEQVKNEYQNKYGNDEHLATLSIAEELGVSNRVIELIDAFQFSKAKENFESQDFDRMIAAYSDMRVEPKQVVSLEQRLADGKKRFQLNKRIPNDEYFFVEMTQYLEKIEEAIFNEIQITPNDITNEKVKIILPPLRNFEISVQIK